MDKKKQNKQNNKQSKTEDKSSIEKKDFSHVTLLRDPVQTLYITTILIGRFMKATLRFMVKHVLLIIALAAAIAGFLYAPGPHVMVNYYKSLIAIVSSYNNRVLRICIMVDRSRSSKFNWIRHWFAHICFVFRTTHCKSYNGS